MLGGSAPPPAASSARGRAAAEGAAALSGNLAYAAGLIDPAYVALGGGELRRRAAAVTALFANRALPEDGWSDGAILTFLHELAAMDANHFSGSVGAGEREGRVACRLVAQRH
jgi:O-phospho-L-seryl-tRNASec:L-selenocysteinyl-tRNA synthase